MNLTLIFKEFYESLNAFFGLISKTYYFGIPLDTTLHVVVGFLITYIGIKLKFSFKKVFIFLFIIESLKALMGAMTIDHNIWHGLKEFFATFIYPAIYWLYLKFTISLKEYKKSTYSDEEPELTLEEQYRRDFYKKKK